MDGKTTYFLRCCTHTDDISEMGVLRRALEEHYDWLSLQR